MINEEMVSPYRPEQAIIVYKRNSDFYLETHSLNNESGKLVWSEGKPFAKDSLKDLGQALSNNAFTPMEIKGLLPDNLLFFQQEYSDITLVWYIPPTKRVLHFKKDLKLKAGAVNLPGLIFAVRQNDLSVVAFKGKNKPSLKTELFKAPFHNIYDDARVCMGNITDHKAKNILEDEMQRWERRFFNSYFSHFLDENVVAKGFNLQILFRDFMKNNKPFPEKALVKSPFKTLDKFIKDIKK